MKEDILYQHSVLTGMPSKLVGSLIILNGLVDLQGSKIFTIWGQMLPF